MKTPLISHFWLNLESWDCNPGLEAVSLHQAGACLSSGKQMG